MTSVIHVPACRVKFCPAPRDPDWHHCWCGQDKIEHHHVESRGMGGSKLKRNVIALCHDHHEAVTLHDCYDIVTEFDWGKTYTYMDTNGDILHTRTLEAGSAAAEDGHGAEKTQRTGLTMKKAVRPSAGATGASAAASPASRSGEGSAAATEDVAEGSGAQAGAKDGGLKGATFKSSVLPVSTKASDNVTAAPPASGGEGGAEAGVKPRSSMEEHQPYKLAVVGSIPTGATPPGAAPPASGESIEEPCASPRYGPSPKPAKPDTESLEEPCAGSGMSASGESSAAEAGLAGQETQVAPASPSEQVPVPKSGSSAAPFSQLTHDERMGIAAEIRREQKQRQWKAGDTANAWERETTEAWQYLDEFGYTHPSLSNIMHVCEAIPPSLRNGRLDYSHHVVVYKLNREDIEMWLERAESEGWNVREFREAVHGERPKAKRPEVVTLCGSTRFTDAYREANLRLTLGGKIVLSVGCDTKSDHELFTPERLADLKPMLDELHLRKIDLSDAILVLNVDGYVGESTSREIEYAQEHRKRVDWLEGK